MADPSQILAARNAEVEQIQGYADLTQEAKDKRIAASSAEKAQIFTSYRSAVADVSLASSPGELEGVLKGAERTGDSLLAKATFHAAIDRGHQQLVDAYLSTRPKAAWAMERYAAAVEEVQQATGIEGLLGTALTERALNGQ
jgi:hypothetical protein